jgi:hypothetical protein
MKIDLHVGREHERRAYVVAGAHELVEPPAEDHLGFGFVDGLELGRSHVTLPPFVNAVG